MAMAPTRHPNSLDVVRCLTYAIGRAMRVVRMVLRRLAAGVAGAWLIYLFIYHLFK